jgi:hypothetical protein
VKISKTERDEQIEKLRKWFPKGSTVYTILRSVSRSGMSRQISIVCLHIKDGRTADNSDARIIDLHPNWSISRALGYRLNKGGAHDAVIVNGCGMDMGFEIAYNLASALYGDGYALEHRWL